MNLGQAIEHLVSTRRSSQTNTAAIRGIGRPLEQTLLHASIHQFDNRVVLEAQSLRSVGDRR